MKLVKSVQLALLLGIAPVAMASLPSYTITNLGGLGGVASEAYGINNAGQIVGSATTAGGQYQAFVWQNGVMTSLGFQGVARAINNNGEIVGETGTRNGWSAPQTPDGRAFYYANGSYTDLGTLAAGNIGKAGAFDINDAGQITGFAYTDASNLPANLAIESQFSRGFIAQKDGNGNFVMTDLGCASDNPAYADCYSRGHGINDNGEIVGRASTTVFGDNDPSTNNSKPFIYWDENQDSSAVTPAGPLFVSTGEDINNSGVSVGTWSDGISRKAAIWTISDGAITETLMNVNKGWNMAINESGLVVGMTEGTARNPGKAYMFDINDLNTVVNLEDLVVGGLFDNGWQTLFFANDINDLGQIVGYGKTLSGQTRAFLLTPVAAVPVPAAAWLMGSGLVGLMALARRRSV